MAVTKTNNTQKQKKGFLYGIKFFIKTYAWIMVAIVATLHLMDWLNILRNNGILIIPETVLYYSLVIPIEFVKGIFI